MKIDRPKQDPEEEAVTADVFNRARLNSVDAFNARRIHSNLNGGSYAGGLVAPKEAPKKKSNILPTLVTVILTMVVLVFAFCTGVAIGLVKLPPDRVVRIPPQFLVLLPKTEGGSYEPMATATHQVVLPGETRAPTITPTPLVTPTPLITSTPTITPVPTLDLSQPTVLCNDGAKVSVAYSKGSCNFHDGIKELLQLIPELPKKP